MSNSKFFNIGTLGACRSERSPIEQMAALCTRQRDGIMQVLFVQSSAGRWILPKGWPMDGKDGADTALIEAWEEAGVRKGEPTRDPIGCFDTTKEIENVALPCNICVYAIKVQDMAKNYPESDQRNRKWVSLGDAADFADDPGLQDFLREFAASHAA